MAAKRESDPTISRPSIVCWLLPARLWKNMQMAPPLKTVIGQRGLSQHQPRAHTTYTQHHLHSLCIAHKHKTKRTKSAHTHGQHIWKVCSQIEAVLTIHTGCTAYRWVLAVSFSHIEGCTLSKNELTHHVIPLHEIESTAQLIPSHRGLRFFSEEKKNWIPPNLATHRIPLKEGSFPWCARSKEDSR